MPKKLLVLIICYGISTLLNLIAGKLIAFLIGVLMLVLLMMGKEGARNLMMIFAFLGLAVIGTACLQNWGAVTTDGVPAGVKALFFGVVGFGLFTNTWCLWTLSRRDVQHYLYQRGMPKY